MHTARKLGLIGLAASLFCGTAGLAQQPAADYDRAARRAAPRDAFPVFHNPPMVSAQRASGLRDEDWVIGVAVNQEARAYPIAVMGVHELGNDTCGGEPIAVSW